MVSVYPKVINKIKYHVKSCNFLSLSLSLEVCNDTILLQDTSISLKVSCLIKTRLIYCYH